MVEFAPGNIPEDVKNLIKDLRLISQIDDQTEEIDLSEVMSTSAHMAQTAAEITSNTIQLVLEEDE